MKRQNNMSKENPTSGTSKDLILCTDRTRQRKDIPLRTQKTQPCTKTLLTLYKMLQNLKLLKTVSVQDIQISVVFFCRTGYCIQATNLGLWLRLPHTQSEMLSLLSVYCRLLVSGSCSFDASHKTCRVAESIFSCIRCCSSPIVCTQSTAIA